MKKIGAFSNLTKDNQKFLAELLLSKKVTENTLRSLDAEKEVEHLPIVEQIEILVEEFRKVGQEKLPRYKRFYYYGES
ncbi:hypothetical protein [Rossellomorea arthrocnemi]|jgi:hypothetical protein|uniref:hypothetical protein n=1 Tax=Rossellomorea arthrocnemi TaxID=2769542 RepID=UPI00191B882C|nr:hypothetical protein [Rossellomorea arthrocnemi]